MKKAGVLVLILALALLSSAQAYAATLQEGRSPTSYTTASGNPAFTFKDKFFYGGQTLPVYSGPGYGWAYIEVKASGEWVRGFVPANCISH